MFEGSKIVDMHLWVPSYSRALAPAEIEGDIVALEKALAGIKEQLKEHGILTLALWAAGVAKGEADLSEADPSVALGDLLRKWPNGRAHVTKLISTTRGLASIDNMAAFDEYVEVNEVLRPERCLKYAQLFEDNDE